MPLKYLFASGFLVIGAAGIRLRLTALVLGAVSDFLLAEGSMLSTAAGSPTRKKGDSLFPLTGPTAEASTSNPPQIGCPKGFLIQWLRTGQGWERPIGQNGVRGDPGGVLVTFSPRKK